MNIKEEDMAAVLEAFAVTRDPKQSPFAHFAGINLSPRQKGNGLYTMKPRSSKPRRSNQEFN